MLYLWAIEWCQAAADVMRQAGADHLWCGMLLSQPQGRHSAHPLCFSCGTWSPLSLSQDALFHCPKASVLISFDDYSSQLTFRAKTSMRREEKGPRLIGLSTWYEFMGHAEVEEGGRSIVCDPNAVFANVQKADARCMYLCKRLHRKYHDEHGDLALKHLTL